MAHFIDYSRYYNLLYKDKKYSEEVEYISSLIKKFSPDAKTVLDAGCGTGKHAKLLAKKGYVVHGIDLSAQMLEIANEEVQPGVTFSQGDLRDYRSGVKYDVVTSLFHVMSYQTTNDDFESSLHTVKEHLNEGGVFIFDCWYGPAVLLDPPAVRVKSMEDDFLKVIRIAEPTMDYNRSVVDVKFEVNVFDKEDRKLHLILEHHPMRYFFQNEISYMASQCGFKVVDMYAWLTMESPNVKSWYITIVCNKF